MNFSPVMDLVTKDTDLIQGVNRSLNHKKFGSFLDEESTVYGDLQVHTEIRWMSCVKSLNRFFALRTEIPAFNVIQVLTTIDSWIQIFSATSLWILPRTLIS